MQHSKRITSVIFTTIVVILLSACNNAMPQMSFPAQTITPFTENTPALIKYAHAGDAATLIWYEVPFSGTYDQLLLKSEGKMEHWLVAPNWATQGANIGYLSKENRQEVKDILNKLRERQSDDMLRGPIAIGLAFSWNGDGKALYYSSLTCDADLRRLLEIANATLRDDRHLQLLLSRLCTPRDYASEPPQAPTPVSDKGFLADSPPDLGRIRTLTVSWSRPTLTNTFDMVLAYSDDSMHYEVLDNSEQKPYFDIKFNDSERQNILDVMSSLASKAPNTLSNSFGSDIVVSFPWEGDYHLLSFDRSKCPDSLQSLFRTFSRALQREHIDSAQLYIPCSE